jgi:DNA-binding NtrC family response regulator
MRRVRAMLFGACVLVAEDECIIAMDLADTFESAGATVIRPAATVREALSLLATKPVDRAFLDFNLADGEVTPVMEMLSSKGVPTVIYTGRGLPPELAYRHPHVKVLRKPESQRRLVAELAAARGKVLPECDRHGSGPPLCGNDVTRRENLCPQSMKHTVSTI